MNRTPAASTWARLSGRCPSFYADVEIDLWWNKYQIPDTSAFNTNQQAVSLLFKYHF